MISWSQLVGVEGGVLQGDSPDEGLIFVMAGKTADKRIFPVGTGTCL